MSDLAHAAEIERLAERCLDAWAVVRRVPANEGQASLTYHGRTGTRDGLDEDLLDAAAALRKAAGRA